VSTAVTQMDHVTQSNSAQTQELSSAAQTLSGQAARVTQLVGRFKLQNYGSHTGEPQPHKPGQPGAARHSAAKGRKQLSHPPALVSGIPDKSARASL
jgi:uncharacterized protein YciW